MVAGDAPCSAMPEGDDGKMEQKSPVHELARISDLFVSSSDKEETGPTGVLERQGTSSDQAGDESEVEETITVRKRIAYPATENARENIKRCLLKHLDEDYMICRVELKRTKEISRPGAKKRTEEEILIFLKDSPHLGDE
ncbi:MAG: hypothetical protein SWQ30_14280 [Thermodesulfobacteriota bacterium]|nr:hypothetical protein [Thermodesulfobacteriota bacterium]